MRETYKYMTEEEFQERCARWRQRELKEECLADRAMQEKKDEEAIQHFQKEETK